jgi:hypothetical protein
MILITSVRYWQKCEVPRRPRYHRYRKVNGDSDIVKLTRYDVRWAGHTLGYSGDVAVTMEKRNNLDDRAYLRRVIHHRNLTQRPL